MSEKTDPIYFPDYACIGFPKCATSFILRRFQDHKFNTLRDGEFRLRFLEENKDRIKHIHEEKQKIAIKSPSIIYSKIHVDTLLNGHTKLIVSIRNPVQWIKSHYNFRLRRLRNGKQMPARFDRVPDFAEIVNDGLVWWGVSLERGMMAKTIKNNLINHPNFDQNRVLFVVQEQLQLEHETVMNEILDFLEVPANNRIIGKDYNFSYKRENRYAVQIEEDMDKILYKKYRPEIKDLSKLIQKYSGKDLARLWKDFYSRKVV